MSSMDRSRTPSRLGRGHASRSPTPRRRKNHQDSGGTSRTRRHSYSDDSYSGYSDSSYTDDESDRRSTHDRGGRGRRTNNKAAPRGRGKPVPGRNSKAQTSPRGIDYITKRMLSARRIKINELRSESETLHVEMVELKKENKMLLKQQRIADRQLDRYEGQEYDLPALLQRHSEEVRALKEQLRRQKDKFQKADKKLRETEDELQRTRRLVKKMRGLVEDKQLKERDELSQKLSKLEAEVDDSNRKQQQLERHAENLTKNHRHELGIERARHKETAIRLQEVEEERQRLQAALKEKEKELEIKNIYSNRVMRAPHKLNSSVSSSPLPDTGRPPRAHRRKNSTPGNMTPREKAKLYADQQRDDMRRVREESEKRERTRQGVDEQHIQRLREEEEQIRREAALREQESNQRIDKMEAEKQQREKAAHQAELDRKQRDKEARREEEEEKLAIQRQREEDDRQDRAEKERRERLAQESAEREQRQKEERERKEREERDRKEQERKEQEEVEKRASEEQNRVANDAAERERRKQKDLLLQRMRVIDNSKMEENDPFLVPETKPDKKDYEFTQPIENMHNGKPAYDNVKVPVLERTRKKGFF